jgi:hypothetical protein
VLGVIRDSTGSYAPGLAGFAAIVILGGVLLAGLGRRWRRSWPESLVLHAGVFDWSLSRRALADSSMRD